MKKIKLGDIGKIFNGSPIPNSEGNFPAYGGNGIIKNVSDFNFDENIIAIGRVGAQCGIVHFSEKKCWITDNCLCFKPNENFNPYYVFYLLKFLNLNKFHIGSAQPLITQSIIENISCDFILEKSLQKQIGNFLYSLDQKISLNKKINATLEEMAKTIYDYYFVQFDFPDENGKPYKSSGGKMIFSPELQREIPEGWQVGNLNLIADYVNGLACQNFRPKDDENFLPVVKIREIHDGINFDTEKVSSNIPEKNIIDDGDILFSWSATLEVNYWAGGQAGLNQHIFKVFPKENFCKEFVYHQLKEYVIHFAKIAESRKTTMGHITQEHLNLSRIAIPPKKILSKFEKKISPIHKKIIQNRIENNLLENLRDFLLPMLMNGQVSFKEED